MSRIPPHTNAMDLSHICWRHDFYSTGRGKGVFNSTYKFLCSPVNPVLNGGKLIITGFFAYREPKYSIDMIFPPSVEELYSYADDEICGILGFEDRLQVYASNDHLLIEHASVPVNLITFVLKSHGILGHGIWGEKGVALSSSVDRSAPTIGTVIRKKTDMGATPEELDAYLTHLKANLDPALEEARALVEPRLGVERVYFEALEKLEKPE